MVCPESFKLSLGVGIDVVCSGLFISSGQGTHPDRILDSYELIVVRKGTLSIWENQVRFEVPAGHSLLLYPGRRHRGAIPFARDLSFYWIHFRLNAPRLEEIEIALPQFAPVQRPECVAELFHRYLEDQEAERLDPLSAQLLLALILCEVARKPSQGKGLQGRALVGRAEAYVTHHLAEKLSTARVARALRVNPDYLNRIFREVHELTMTEYIHRRKVSDAAGMLRETTDSVSEIAAACGYSSAGHFRRVFERQHGVPPSAYRRLMARAFVNAR